VTEVAEPPDKNAEHVPETADHVGAVLEDEHAPGKLADGSRDYPYGNAEQAAAIPDHARNEGNTRTETRSMPTETRSTEAGASSLLP
jgi:hypothetical protein